MVLEERIIKPLNLENTFPYHSNQIDFLAHPILDDQDFHNLPKIGVNLISVGIGNIISDANDVNTFLRQLFIDQTILLPETLLEMKVFQSYNTTKIRLGVFRETFGDQIVSGHTGRTISYIAYAFVDETDNTSFVLLCNNANDDYIDVLIDKIGKK